MPAVVGLITLGAIWTVVCWLPVFVTYASLQSQCYILWCCVHFTDFYILFEFLVEMKENNWNISKISSDLSFSGKLGKTWSYTAIKCQASRWGETDVKRYHTLVPQVRIFHSQRTGRSVLQTLLSIKITAVASRIKSVIKIEKEVRLFDNFLGQSVISPAVPFDPSPNNGRYEFVKNWPTINRPGPARKCTAKEKIGNPRCEKGWKFFQPINERIFTMRQPNVYTHEFLVPEIVYTIQASPLSFFGLI